MTNKKLIRKIFHNSMFICDPEIISKAKLLRFATIIGQLDNGIIISRSNKLSIFFANKKGSVSYCDIESSFNFVSEDIRYKDYSDRPLLSSTNVLDILAFAEMPDNKESIDFLLKTVDIRQSLEDKNQITNKFYK